MNNKGHAKKVKQMNKIEKDKKICWRLHLKKMVGNQSKIKV